MTLFLIFIYCLVYMQEYESYLNDYDLNDGQENINEMDIEKLSKELDSISMIISAPRRSGKTHLIRDILFKMGQYCKWDLIILYSETALFNVDYDYISDKFKFDHYDSEHLEKIINQQSHNMIKYKKQKMKGKQPPKILIILDDCISGNKILYDENIAKLYTLGRHLKISVIFLTQHLNALSPKIKKNSDVLIFFRNPDLEQSKELQDRYMHLFNDDRKKISNIIDRIYDEPYKCVVVCVYKIQKAEKISDYIYYYRAPEAKPEQFRLGQPQFWIESNEPRKDEEDYDTKRGLCVPAKELDKVFKKYGTHNAEISSGKISGHRKKKK